MSHYVNLLIYLDQIELLRNILCGETNENEEFTSLDCFFSGTGQKVSEEKEGRVNFNLAISLGGLTEG